MFDYQRVQFVQIHPPLGHTKNTTPCPQVLEWRNFNSLLETYIWSIVLGHDLGTYAELGCARYNINSMLFSYTFNTASEMYLPKG